MSMTIRGMIGTCYADVGNVGGWGDQGDGTFLNPVLESDYSDPDVIRVGDRYYMITSTFQLHPGMAILESADLVNWKTINYCLTDLASLDPNLNWDRMNRYGKGVYAGSLRYLEWKEDDGSGNLVSRHKWFMHTTLFDDGFVVATADDVYGKWTAQYMKDKNDNDLRAPRWDDPCPYWEFNDDGTLKAAYLVASKCNGAWYPHVFQMSLDGAKLLDADVSYMSRTGDFTRQRTEEGTGEIVSRTTGSIIQTSKGIYDAHNTQMNADGDIQSVLDATHITGREGTVIRDVYTAEANKVIKFGKDTEIGNSTFSGRHGINQKVSDYIYMYDNECWDGHRIAVISRAKSIYGDKFDKDGNYIGPGSPGDPGTFETQRILVPTTNYDREPNQGGYVDIPSSMSKDGEEHWYWMTHQGDQNAGPQARPTSLQPVTWVNGFPIAGIVSGEMSKGTADVSATIYDGTGLSGNTNSSKHHPNAKYVPGSFAWGGEMPPIKGEHQVLDFQSSDEFNYTQFNSVSKLDPMWQWNYQPRNGYWDLTGNALRLYAFRSLSGENNLFKVGNMLCQRYINADIVTAEIKMDLSGMKDGQEAGFAHFNGGGSYSAIRVNMAGGKKYIDNKEIKADSVILKTVVDFDRYSTFSYSLDGGVTFTEYGQKYKLTPSGYRGDYIGFYTFNNNETSASLPQNGYVDVDYFRYDYSRHAVSEADRAFPRDSESYIGRRITLIDSRSSCEFWFAPEGTTVFSQSTVMTKSESSIEISAPAEPGKYKLYAVRDGRILSVSAASLTVKPFENRTEICLLLYSTV